MNQHFPDGTLAKHRDPVERTFVTHDGSALFFRHWPAVGIAAKGAIVLFHRGHEHSGRMAHLVDELDLTGYVFSTTIALALLTALAWGTR